jgi:lysophospholipase L1-like esterase
MSEPAEVTDRAFPRTRDYPWMSREEWDERRNALLAIPPERRRDAKLVFLGDSIVEGWTDASWDESFGAYAPLRLGIGGDMTQHVLWRIEQGELAHLRPDLMVLLIGTNNLGNAFHTPRETARGVEAIVRVLEQHLPNATLLVVGLLPRDEPIAPLRRQVAETNALLVSLENGRNIRYVDVGESFVSSDGKIPLEIMEDALHPTPNGYRLFARSLLPTLTTLLNTR